MKKRHLYLCIIFSIIIFPDFAFACATCFGDPNAAATQGMNKAIFTMLGITGGVLGSIGSSIYVLSRRAKKYENSLLKYNHSIDRKN